MEHIKKYWILYVIGIAIIINVPLISVGQSGCGTPNIKRVKISIWDFIFNRENYCGTNGMIY